MAVALSKELIYECYFKDFSNNKPKTYIMKQVAKYLIKATIVLIAIGLLAGGITYAIIGINFCIDGVYGARQALGHFFICGLYIFLACIVFASKNSDCAGEFFNDK